VTRLFWAEGQPSSANEQRTNVLEIGDASSRLIVRSRRASALNTWVWFLSILSYYGIAIAIALSPLYQAWAPWQDLTLKRAILTLLFLGGILHLFRISWWVPRFSAHNPRRVIEIQIKTFRLGLLKHRLEVGTEEEVFTLIVRCPRRRLAKALDGLEMAA
jgi:hypothetical protein